MNDWIQITARFDEAPEDWSIFADAFNRFGCPGTQQQDFPPSLTAHLANVEGADAQVQQLTAELKRLGVPTVEIEEAPDQDWSELWKIHFKPRRVGKRFVIVPTWEDYSASPGDLRITLDPGQAFGTGDHPTTRLCLELMEDHEFAGKTVLDVGCGSGVLAIGAALLGAQRIRATDIDPLSVSITRENAELNQAKIEADAVDGFAETEQPYDFVLSNIISATLIRLAPEAARCVKPSGYWIVSGIIESNWPEVQRAAEGCGFRLSKVLQENEWVGATFLR